MSLLFGALNPYTNSSCSCCGGPLKVFSNRFGRHLYRVGDVTSLKTASSGKDCIHCLLAPIIHGPCLQRWIIMHAQGGLWRPMHPGNEASVNLVTLQLQAAEKCCRKVITYSVCKRYIYCVPTDIFDFCWTDFQCVSVCDYVVKFSDPL